MTTYTIIKLGHIKHKFDFGCIQRWTSKLFRVNEVKTCEVIPDGKSDWQEFNDKDLNFVRPADDADITVAITEYALQDNFFARRLPNGVIVLSFYEIADILKWDHIPLEHFVIRNLYEFFLLFHIYKQIPPTTDEIPDIFHDESRSCLFDICGLKRDITFSTSKPSICTQCRAKLSSSQLPEGTMRILEKELRRIRKPIYYKITDFIKRHHYCPVKSRITTIGYELHLVPIRECREKRPAKWAFSRTA